MIARLNISQSLKGDENMNLKKLAIMLTSLVLICLVIISCKNKGDSVIFLDSNDNFLEFLEVEYNYYEVQEAIKAKPTMKQFNKIINQRKFKKYDGGYYTLVDTVEGLFIVGFNLDESFTGCMQISFSDELSNVDISDLTVGLSLNEVIKLDPCAQYNFLYASVKNFPKISYHFFRNGTVCVVNYDNLNRISQTKSVVI